MAFNRVDHHTGLLDISAGTNISIDKTDPYNPIISSSGGGGASLPGGTLGEYLYNNGTEWVSKQIDYSEIANIPGSATDFVSQSSGGTFDNAAYAKFAIGVKNSSGNNRGLLSLNGDSGRLRLYDGAIERISLRAESSSFIHSHLAIGKSSLPSTALDVNGTVTANAFAASQLNITGNMVSSVGNSLNLSAGNGNIALRVDQGAGLQDAVLVRTDGKLQLNNRFGITPVVVAGFDPAGTVGAMSLSNKFSINNGQLLYAESDPTVGTHIKNISTTDVNNWNETYTFYQNYQPPGLNDVATINNTTTSALTVGGLSSSGIISRGTTRIDLNEVSASNTPLVLKSRDDQGVQLWTRDTLALSTNNDSTVSINSLSGVGTRMVVTNPTGKLSTQPLTAGKYINGISRAGSLLTLSYNDGTPAITQDLGYSDADLSNFQLGAEKFVTSALVNTGATTHTATFTKNDGTTFTMSWPVNGGSTGDGNDFVDGLSFTGGVLTLSRTGSLVDLSQNLYTDLDSRYLQSYIESDPVFVSSPSFGISSTDISNWDSAYNFSVNYNTPTLQEVASAGSSYTGTIITGALQQTNRTIATPTALTGYSNTGLLSQLSLGSRLSINSGVLNVDVTGLGGGTGVSGISGRIPVFDGSPDGVGNSIITEVAGGINIPGVLSSNILETGNADINGILSADLIQQIDTTLVSPTRIAGYSSDGLMAEMSLSSDFTIVAGELRAAAKSLSDVTAVGNSTSDNVLFNSNATVGGLFTVNNALIANAASGGSVTLPPLSGTGEVLLKTSSNGTLSRSVAKEVSGAIEIGDYSETIGATGGGLRLSNTALKFSLSGEPVELALINAGSLLTLQIDAPTVSSTGSLKTDKPNIAGSLFSSFKLGTNGSSQPLLEIGGRVYLLTATDITP